MGNVLTYLPLKRTNLVTLNVAIGLHLPSPQLAILLLTSVPKLGMECWGILAELQSTNNS